MLDRLDADFTRISSDLLDAEAQLAVESGKQQRAAVSRFTALDRPASEWTDATRAAATDELAHIFGSADGK